MPQAARSFGQAIGSRSWAPASGFDRGEFDRGIGEIEKLGFVPL
jgi:hypothetical protein